jgi:PhnB protein
MKEEQFMVQKKPEGYHAVTPYLIVNDAGKLIDFLTEAFGAKEKVRMPGPDGMVAHAEVEIGDSVVMMGTNPDDLFPAMLYVYVDDADETYRKALAAGGTSHEEPNDTFYGDRRAEVRDPWGNRWSIATHIEDVSEEEMDRRMKKMMQQAAPTS